MYVEKDLPVQLFGGGTTLNRAQRSSTRRRERRRKNVQEPTPTSSTITFSLPSSSPSASQPTHRPHKYRLINLHPSITPLPIQLRNLRSTPPIHFWGEIACWMRVPRG
jgi:hypothetical protein